MYQLIDSGDGEKLEKFAEVTLIRPCPQALWKKTHESWRADARFTREGGWEATKRMPDHWEIELEGMRFKLKCTSFGHLGIFPEQQPFWRRIKEMQAERVLNLFAYTGGSSMAAALSGAEVTHVDASKPTTLWASENAKINGLSIRWVVEDAQKFLKRAVQRKESYDAIILDPPSFGRGKSGQLFKIEEDLVPILEQCAELLKKPKYLLLTCHTPGITPIVLKQLLSDIFEGEIEWGEMVLKGPHLLPSGAYAFIK